MNPAKYEPSWNFFWHDGRIWMTSALDTIEDITLDEEETDYDGEEYFECDEVIKYYPASWDDNEQKIKVDRTADPIIRTINKGGFKEQDGTYCWNNIHDDFCDYKDAPFPYREEDDCIPAASLTALHLNVQ